jgi:hypothetical protein
MFDFLATIGGWSWVLLPLLLIVGSLIKVYKSIKSIYAEKKSVTESIVIFIRQISKPVAWFVLWCWLLLGFILFVNLIFYAFAWTAEQYTKDGNSWILWLPIWLLITIELSFGLATMKIWMKINPPKEVKE